jgi:hypothetical protein
MPSQRVTGYCINNMRNTYNYHAQQGHSYKKNKLILSLFIGITAQVKKQVGTGLLKSKNCFFYVQFVHTVQPKLSASNFQNQKWLKRKVGVIILVIRYLLEFVHMWLFYASH